MDYGAHFDEQTKHAFRVNRENLRTLLSDNRDTVFGRRYDFSTIKDEDEYRRRVPLSDYEGFREDVGRMLSGETDILTVYPVLSYCHSSGTTGKAKIVPVTAESERRFGNLAVCHADDLIAAEGGKRLLINTFRTDLDGSFEKHLIATEIYYRYAYENGWFCEEQYIGGRLLNFQSPPR